MSTPTITTPTPLRFLSADTIATHVTDPDLKSLAVEAREAVDRTEAASARLFNLTQPERDREASTADHAAALAAAKAATWIDPGATNMDRLATDRAAAVSELHARASVSDRLVIRWSKQVATRAEEVAAVDLAAVAKASATIVPALEKLRPALVQADERSRRVEWLRWLAANRLDSVGRKYLSPDRVPLPDSLVDRLDEIIAATQPGT